MNQEIYSTALQEAVLLLHASLQEEDFNMESFLTEHKEEVEETILKEAIVIYQEQPYAYLKILLQNNIAVLPKLSFSSRKGDWDLLPESIRDSMLYAYLFESMPLRELDESYLLLDSAKTKGFDSHRILHHMGITGVFRGIFHGFTLAEGLDLLEEAGQAYKGLHEALSRFGYSLYQEEPFSENDNLESRVRSSTGYAYYTTRYERSPYLRKLAMDEHGLTCMACGFNFEEVYGELGKDFIEVHHTVPLPDPRQDMIVDPERDLLCLCSNCHRMIHRNPTVMMSVEELKDLIEKEKKKNKR